MTLIFFQDTEVIWEKKCAQHSLTKLITKEVPKNLLEEQAKCPNWKSWFLKLNRSQLMDGNFLIKFLVVF